MGNREGNKKLPKPAYVEGKKGKPGSGIARIKSTPGDYLKVLFDGIDKIEAGKYEQAQKQLTELAEKYKDDNWLAVLYLADSYFLQDKIEEAEELYRSCVEFNPMMAHSLYGLALVLQTNGDNETAKALVERSQLLLGLSSSQKIPDYLPSFE